jgi:hypothetical protein
LERATIAMRYPHLTGSGAGRRRDPATKPRATRWPDHTVVYLSVELRDAVKRVGLGAGRPLLAINPRATLKYLLDQRRPLYAEVATAHGRHRRPGAPGDTPRRSRPC